MAAKSFRHRAPYVLKTKAYLKEEGNSNCWIQMKSDSNYIQTINPDRCIKHSVSVVKTTYFQFHRGLVKGFPLVFRAWFLVRRRYTWFCWKQCFFIVWQHITTLSCSQSVAQNCIFQIGSSVKNKKRDSPLATMVRREAGLLYFHSFWRTTYFLVPNFCPHIGWTHTYPFQVIKLKK